MLVTPNTKKFGKYAPGDKFSLPDKTAKALIAAKLVREAEPDAEISERTGRPKRTYRRRDMQAES